MDSSKLNVLFSSDDNYAAQLGAAMRSVLENSTDFEQTRIFIIENGISEENKKRLMHIAEDFPGASVFFESFEEKKRTLDLDMVWSISLSSYARLFAGSLLPADVERVLYLDCDTIVCKSLRELWEQDLGGCTIGAVQDAVSSSTKAAVGLCAEDKYFNSGVLLIDLKRWRSEMAEKKCLEYIKSMGGRVVHHDQGVLNHVFRAGFKRLSLEYNLMTVHYIFSPGQIAKYYRDRSEFYPDGDIQAARQSPTILHFTPSFTTRPWVRGCKHPKKELYFRYLSKTPFSGRAPDRDLRKWYVKLIEFRYRCLPY